MRIWILEDYAELRRILAFLAAEAGYQVTELSSMREAWEVLENPHLPDEPPDMVLSDFSLEDGTSGAWLREIRSRHPRTRVICFSGELDPEIRRRLESDSILYIPKPSSLGAIVEILCKVRG